MIILDEPTYRSHPAANFSSLKTILKSPKHYQTSLKQKFEPSIEMTIGTIVHEAVLEGKPYSHIVKPADIDLRTKEGKAWRDKHAGMMILSQSEHSTVVRTVEAVKNSADAQYLLNLCKQREIGIVHNYKGVEIKGRLDAYGQDEGGKPIIVDFKTTSEADPELWGRKAFGLRYMMQMQYYKALLSLELGLDVEPSYVWLVAETNEAADVCVYQPPPEAIAIGQAQMDYAIETYKKCLESGYWQTALSISVSTSSPFKAQRKSPARTARNTWQSAFQRAASTHMQMASATYRWM